MHVYLGINKILLCPQQRAHTLLVSEAATWLLLRILILIKGSATVTTGRRKIMVKDPVCGMDVDEKAAQWKSAYKGKTYYFCAERCKQVFDKKPERFVK